MNWASLEIDEVLKRLETNPDTGLSSEEAKKRFAHYGPNKLEEREGPNPIAIFFSQFTEIMVVILLIASAISFLLGDVKETIAILVIVILNAVLGFVQEYRAERALQLLRKLATPVVKVKRDGRIKEIRAEELVPGDIVLLEAGTRVQADLRLIEAINLRTDEAPLTGESTPVDKNARVVLPPETPVSDRVNMAFMGTGVTYGRGMGVVVETGMRTELGRIARMIQTVRRETSPLQEKMAQVGKGLAVAAGVLVLIVFILGLWRGEDLHTMFLTAVSLAVAAVPEGLPAVVTITLALGAQRMVKRNALIRKLPAVETLGSVTVICSDKTGTLTENRMTVTILDVAGETLDLTEKLSKVGPFLEVGENILEEKSQAIHLLLVGGALCNDSYLEPDSIKPSRFYARGDPTEGAMVIAAARFGLWKDELEKQAPRVSEVPFTSERKRMTTVHRINDDNLIPFNTPYVAFCKGAVSSLLEISSRVWNADHPEPLDDSWRERIVRADTNFASQGMRVLGVAFRPLEEIPDEPEKDMIFVGMMAMIDPPRPEVKEAVAKCKSAGIRPVMITGDHPQTALYIARQLGMDEGGEVITGAELEKMTVEELEEKAEKVTVYARVSPEHKLKIVQALQRRGHIVAMTGDGVNDAPALKKADIGVAMGIMGTDVSKEASEMVLLDDNFATIVAAVEEGRVIYDNIRKFIKYTLSSNTGEIFLMLVAPLLGRPMPLTPLQILWINLVTDGLPGLAFGFDPAEPDTMKRPPRPPGENVFAKLWKYILLVGSLMGFTALLPALLSIGSEASWRTMVFTTLALAQMGNALVIRSEKESIFRIGFTSNPILLVAVFLTFILQLMVIYIPPLQKVFKTVALSWWELLISLALASIVFWTIELAKWLRREIDKSRVT
ncbi:MAG: cation-translocating P-type ATPase [Anaerolineae bacterium]|nr:cation-translocating P-type ATPase [Anaerolineae bacterium]MDW8101332.1 cation-translocating P-type ATPase [Anaerolineae bacterium]